MKKGFTLAEVLITLAVIGIVAAMTIPNLVQGFQEKVIVTQLKKTYSMLSQTTELVKIEHPFSEWNYRNATIKGVSTVWELYLPYLKTVKDCGCAYPSIGCWSKDTTKLLNNNNYRYAGEGYIGYPACSARLADGTNVTLDVMNTSKMGINGEPLLFYVDVNGDKRPNQLGKDVFIFIVRSDKGIIVPAGADNDSSLCDAINDDFAGLDCAAKVLKENKLPK